MVNGHRSNTYKNIDLFFSPIMRRPWRSDILRARSYTNLPPLAKASGTTQTLKRGRTSDDGIAYRDPAGENVVLSLSRIWEDAVAQMCRDLEPQTVWRVEPKSIRLWDDASGTDDK